MIILYCILGLVGVALILVLISVINAGAKGKKIKLTDNFSIPHSKQEQYSKVLSQMIKFETVTSSNGNNQRSFDKYYLSLQQLFPIFFAKSQSISIKNGYLFLVKGISSQKANLVMAHSDVVPAEGEWLYPAYSGEIADDKIWGRGAIDNKGMLCAILLSLNKLLEGSYQPKYDLYIFSGCDEETFSQGAQNCRNYFVEHKIWLDTTLDEGGVLSSGNYPTVDNDTALLGMGEKGYVDIEFTAEEQGGHSSMPHETTALAELVKFMNYINTHQQFKVRFLPLIKQMFESISPYMSFGLRILLCNFWLYGGLLKLILPKVSPATNAIVRTTLVFTRVNASLSNNTISPTATAIANIRTLPGQSIKEVFDRLAKVASKFGLTAKILYSKDASKITPPNCPHFANLKALVAKIYPNTIVLPYILSGASDACYMDDVSSQIIRFNPIKISTTQLNSMHSNDENVSQTEFAKSVDFMREYFLTK
ncbi:MAG: M20/M25/M40 family metallo-hydrolase [Clostridia bacterium]